MSDDFDPTFNHINVDWAETAKERLEEIIALHNENDILSDALMQIKAIGDSDMPPDYNEWLDSHTKIAKIATEALIEAGVDTNNLQGCYEVEIAEFLGCRFQQNSDGLWQWCSKDSDSVYTGFESKESAAEDFHKQRTKTEIDDGLKEFREKFPDKLSRIP